MVAGRPRAPGALRAARIVHPFPTLLNALVTGGLGLIATDGHASPVQIAHLMLAMTVMQAGIGTVNDLADRELDARSKAYKPLVAGLLSTRTAVLLALICLGATVALSAGFGPAAWLLAMACLGCGLVYDLWLKRTSASALPFIVALPLLPIWVWTALGRFRVELLALVPLGCLLGLSLHLANSLPDYESDAESGVRGLAHIIGRRGGKRAAIAVCWGSFALLVAAVSVSAAFVAYRLVVLAPGLAIAAGLLAVTVALYLRSPSRRALQTGWSLLATGGAVLALAWLAALPGR